MHYFIKHSLRIVILKESSENEARRIVIKKKYICGLPVIFFLFERLLSAF